MSTGRAKRIARGGAGGRAGAGGGSAGGRSGVLLGSLVFLASLVVSACGTTGGERPPAQDRPAAPERPDAQAEAAAEAPGRRAASEREALFWERLESARDRYTEADVSFMTGMIAHHAQAVEMAELVPDRTENPSIRTLAARILNAQLDEIAIMEQWLLERGEPVPIVPGTKAAVEAETADGARAARGEHAGHGSHGGGAGEDPHAARAMPGMLTPEQMRALARAEGRAFDRLFLASMIEHHRGAVTMVRELFATEGAGQDPAVFKFASDVQVDQRTEIARMETMLRALPGA